MKLYEIRHIDDIFYIFETASKNIIHKFTDKNQALKYCKFMNRGQHGFQGWTPDFITK